MTDKETPRQPHQNPQQQQQTGDQQQQSDSKDKDKSSSTSPSMEPNVSLETIAVTVAPFTGGPFTLNVRRKDSIEDLKKAVAKKLKVLKDRICLLYRER